MSLTSALKNCTRLALNGDWRTALYHVHNRLRGLDLRFASVGELGLSEARSNWYSDSGGPRLSRALETLSISRSDRALDIGCGKGGAIITLARRPFQRVDGVEISERLVSIARNNIRKMRIRNAAVFHCDAAEYSDLDSYTFIYLANPFPHAVMEAVVRNLAASLERAQRKVTLVYYNPVDRDLFERLGFVPRGQFPHDENPTVVFVREPQGVMGSGSTVHMPPAKSESETPAGASRWQRNPY